MNDEEVLDAVKQTLSDVRMDRPIEAIERRGRARRRKRGLFGLAAGGGLAAVAALALTLPMATAQPTPDAAGSSTAALEPAAFTLVKQSDSTVKLTLRYQQILDPVDLQKALAFAGVPATVKTHALCTPAFGELRVAPKVYWTENRAWPDGSGRDYLLVIAPASMPANSRLYFSLVAAGPGDDFAKAAQFLVSDDDPMRCRPIN